MRMAMSLPGDYLMHKDKMDDLQAVILSLALLSLVNATAERTSELLQAIST